MALNKERYIAAGIITMVIFLLGFSIGLVVEGQRITYVQDKLAEQKTEFSSSQLQYDYLSSLNTKESCPAIFKSFSDNLVRLDDTRLRLETYINDNTINQESFDLLKREYTLEQIRYWLLSKQAKDLCDDKFVRIMYFYSDPKECPTCEDQQTVLLYYKKLLKQDLLIFSLDAQFTPEPMIGILLKRYNISNYPTLVIDDQPIGGFTDRETLQSALCREYGNTTDDTIRTLCT